MNHVQSVNVLREWIPGGEAVCKMSQIIFFRCVFEYKGVNLLSEAEGSLPGQTRCPPAAEWRVSVGC